MEAGEEGPEPRPGVGASLVTLVVSLLLILVGGCLLGSLFINATSDPAAIAAALKDPLFLVGAMVVTQIAMLIALRTIPRKLDDVGREGFRERIAWRPARFSWVDVAPTVLGTITAGGLTHSLVKLVHTTAPDGMLEQFGAASKATASSPGMFVMLLLSGTIGAAVTEEMMFRGLLQTRFVQRYGPLVGIVVPAALFGVWHFDLEQSATAFGIGLWLGWCAWSQGTIVTVMVAHFANNLTAFVGQRLSTTSVGAPGAAAVIIRLVVFGCCAAFLVWRHRKVDVSTADFPPP